MEGGLKGEVSGSHQDPFHGNDCLFLTLAAVAAASLAGLRAAWEGGWALSKGPLGPPQGVVGVAPWAASRRRRGTIRESPSWVRKSVTTTWVRNSLTQYIWR